MSQNSKPWPPLVGVDNVPAWARWRDVLLTLLAWLALLALLRHSLLLLHDYLTAPYFEFTRLAPPDWQLLAFKLRPFFIAAGLLVVWMLVWALVRRRQLAAREPQPPPAPLVLADHAAHWGLDQHALAVWRVPKIGLATFDERQRLVSVQSQTPPQVG